MSDKPREEQLAYSNLMGKMLDEQARRQKAAKLISVIAHGLGRTDTRGPEGAGEGPLTGLRAVDVGCSAGFIADELALAGAKTTGVDIDEPGLAKARARFGDRVDFRLARGEDLPFEDGSIDVAVLNHIYEHVVDPEAVVADIHRVLAPGGVLYLGIGHRWQIIEPHHRLPFLSWLPQSAADRYMRLTGKGEHYYEHYSTPAGLKRMFAAFDVWDYTLPVLADPEAFSGGDVIPAWVGKLPEQALAATLPLVPTYVWLAFRSPARPAGPELRVAPRHVSPPRHR
ncbi:ubiquinone biosynthesis O-methyltransferase [Knoellia sinensis KCTC 19936]|uniref:Ubiquinone biosynthesis O-methyltransferase n=1 Tax=Knoellia sinensis KCTC 19936 TaxID=1385520 RepID=A0A0A0J6H7_9MICO|nr:class I SAM-dependent methyltransferase [Knoellia sinensis]KGN32384.1 ubiquinone biosynthesis O-methyltransferase [Knoellia sinensis KCTC 19936]